MKLILTLLLVTFAVFCSSESLDLGDLKQFEPRSNFEAPKLTGKKIWLSYRDENDDSLDIVASDDAQKEIQAIFKGCGKNIDSACFNKVRSAVRDLPIEYDSKPPNQKRTIFAKLSKTFKLLGKKAGSPLAALAEALALIWTMKYRDNNGDPGMKMFLKASDASKLDETASKDGPLKVSANGKNEITITWTSTDDKCPKKNLLCGEAKGNDCEMQDPVPGGDGDVFCASGPYKGCPCYAPTPEFGYKVPPADMESLIRIGDVLSRLAKPGRQKAGRAVCSNTLGGFPANLFGGASGTKTKVYETFCHDLHLNINKENFKMTVDASGKPKATPKGKLRIRTPPLNGGDYDQYSLELEYMLTPQDPKDCPPRCKEALEILSTACSRDSQMAASGKIHSGCGTFTYTVLKKGQTKPALPQERNCYGLIPNKYAERSSLADVIENKFCPEAVKQQHLDNNSGAISRIYNQGTPEEIGIAIEWKPGMDFKPDQKSCVDNLLGGCVDACDVPGQPHLKNPYNRKGGGESIVGSDKGNVRYVVAPKIVRAIPYDIAPGAACYKDTSNDGNMMLYTLYGRGGGLTSDKGALLKSVIKEMMGKAPDPFDFTYHYEKKDGNDIEWRVHFAYERKIPLDFTDRAGIRCTLRGFYIY
ncbi:hypothetical protein QQS21_009700 [Conoideocrella luteorostrata]|uniref:Uncharacterized protein n=1 Tax=Conoideocrella luteorostrata TaxID=1105319 RepID=A0AAJ0CIR6_9HYPO|nr:hypothetical protein QQS21_009700 [Conoideocrella luteorostrata]